MSQQKYRIAIYSQNTSCAGHICPGPERIYGSDARYTHDLEWFYGTRSSLLADAYDAMQHRGLHGLKIFNSIVRHYFRADYKEALAAYLRRARSLKAASTRRARRTAPVQE
jgi:hypothetical protein